MGVMGFVSLQNVHKRYVMGDVTIHAVQGMSFDIGQGELAVIVGPSGSGKTTILNILGGMDTCDEGKVIVDGREIQHYNRRQLIQYRRQDIGFVFQFYNLIPNLTASENVELAAQISKDFIPAAEILDRVGLGERLNNFPAQLSGGEQQRVAIARALINRPEVLLADEPTGNLDSFNAHEIMHLLEEINQRGTTMIVVTHSHEMVQQMKKRVITMERGAVIQDEGGSR